VCSYDSKDRAFFEVDREFGCFVGEDFPLLVSFLHVIVLPPVIASVPLPLVPVNVFVAWSKLNSGSAAVAIVAAMALSAAIAVMATPTMVSFRMLVAPCLGFELAIKRYFAW
jgi:hypothetical protein